MVNLLVHKENALFKRLSSYSNSVSLLVLVHKTKKMDMINVQFSSMRWESENKKDNTDSIKLRYFKSKSASAHKLVLKDVDVGEGFFISVDGIICASDDYEATIQSVDFSKIASEIYMNQFDSSNTIVQDYKIKTIHFSEIPTIPIFKRELGFDYNLGRYTYMVVTKYNHHRLSTKKGALNHLGKICPLVEGASYENINFYEDDKTWFNPIKKIVQINHAVNSESFFDKDGYLCSTENFRMIDDEDIVLRKKIFLFLV